MRAVVQRVSEARVSVEGSVVGQIEAGLLVLLGVERGDTLAELHYLADKIIQLRIFEDQAGKMNRSLVDSDGSMLLVSQFTLLGDCRKGRRPAFTAAEEPQQAKAMYEAFGAYVQGQGIALETGRFAADMQVQLINDGPVTIWIDTRDHLQGVR